MAKYAVELRAVSKAYGRVLASRSVDLKIRSGTIHALIGENGAGKSTAMKILYGMARPDSGEVLVRGRSVGAGGSYDSQAAIRLGIGMVHQHFMLAEPCTVLENIILGCEPAARGPWGWLPRAFRPVSARKARAKLDSLASRYGISVDWDARIEELSVGILQRVEILKLLYRDADILILDEPTAVLTPAETRELFGHLRGMKAEGKTLLLITHKLKEVLELADEVSVMRAGSVMGTFPVGETDALHLADLMVGRRVGTVVAAPARSLGTPALEVEGLALGPRRGEARSRLSRLHFQVREGEIVGVAGVEGNGQSELLGALRHPADFGSRLEGAIRCLGTAIVGEGKALSAREIRSLGIGFIPEDRHREGLLLERPLTENFLLGLQRAPVFARRGWIRRARLLGATERALAGFDVRPRDPGIEASRLSGGNQQKVIIARELFREPRLLIAAQPTRGVDVGAIELIHRRIVEARDRGAGVLLISSELDEILALSDRILVLYEGRIVAEIPREQADERVLGLRMGGGTG